MAACGQIDRALAGGDRRTAMVLLDEIIEAGLDVMLDEIVAAEGAGDGETLRL